MVEFDKLADDRLGEPSASIRERVESARDKQRLRFEETELVCNADMGPSGVRIYCGLDNSGRALIRQAIATHGASLSSSAKVGANNSRSFGG
jgi:magnesium chelatase family protein